MKKFGIEPSASLSSRPSKLASLIEHELSVLLRREVEFPAGVLVTIVKVSVLPDLSSARVAVSVLPFAERHKIFAQLLSVRGNLQRILSGKLTMYRMPKLEFMLDETAEKAQAMDELLDSLG